MMRVRQLLASQSVTWSKQLMIERRGYVEEKQRKQQKCAQTV